MLLDNNADLYMDIGDLYLSTYRDIMGTHVWERGGAEIASFATKAKNSGFGHYGLADVNEFISEAIAQYFCADKQGDIANKVIKMLIGE